MFRRLANGSIGNLILASLVFFGLMFGGAAFVSGTSLEETLQLLRILAPLVLVFIALAAVLMGLVGGSAPASNRVFRSFGRSGRRTETDLLKALALGVGIYLIYNLLTISAPPWVTAYALWLFGLIALLLVVLHPWLARQNKTPLFGRLFRPRR